MEPATWTAYHAELFHVRRSVKYHDYRRRFFENVVNVSLLLAAGSGPLLALLGTSMPATDNDGFDLKLLPALVTSVFTGIALVGRVVGKANLHNELKVEFIRLRQDMERHRGDAEDQDVAEWTAQRLAIEEREPPINRVIDAMCHNEVVQSQGVDDKTQYVRVLPWHRWVGPYTRYFDNSLRHYKPDERGPFGLA